MPRSGWLAIGAAAGALAGGLSPPVALAVAGSAIFGAGVLAGSALAARVRVVAFSLGLLVVALRVAFGSSSPSRVDLAEGTTRWTGVVESIGSPRDGKLPLTVALDVGDLRIAATAPRYPVVEPGDRVALTGTVSPPGDDTYGAYLRSHGLAGSLYARTIEKLSGASEAAGHLEAVRRASGDALGRSIPEPEAGLASGILIGLRDRVDRDLATAFTTAGVSHVVAISGWNIAIVAACIGALVRSRRRRERTLITLVAIALYTLFAGASPSVLRAATMAGVVLTARDSGRAGRAAAALGWAATVLLVIDPGMVADAGFLLSTVATAGLLLWAEPVTAWLQRLAGGRLPAPLCEILGVSLAAQAATLPLILAMFGRLSLVAPIANLLVVPLVAPAMAAGLLALAGGWLAMLGGPALAASILGLPAWALLSLTVALVRTCAALPFASVALQPPLNLVAAAGVAGLIVVIERFRRRPPVAVAAEPTRHAPSRPPAPNACTRRPERLVVSALLIAMVALGIVVVQLPDGRVHLTVLDVGQGDAILVEGDRGGRMLIDGGPDPDRLVVALDGELPPWDRRIDLVVLSHPHEDHVAGLPVLLDRYRFGRVVEPGMLGPGPGYRAWADSLAARGVETGRLAAGDAFALDGIEFVVLWPDPGSVPRQPPNTGTGINNVSIVLLATFDRQRFLLAGDVEEAIDPVLLSRGLPRVDFLKVAHHGSRTSSTDAFLAAITPSVAAVSVGARNPYGHPAPATLQRLTAHGSRVYRTDRDGSIAATLDGTSLHVRAEGRRVADAEREAPAARAAVGATTATAATGLAFSCGIPIQGPPAAGLAAGIPSTVGARPTRVYHRSDGRSWARRGRPSPPIPRPAALVPAALASGGGSRSLARPADRTLGHRGSATHRGSWGLAARHRQGTPARRSRGRAPPR